MSNIDRAAKAIFLEAGPLSTHDAEDVAQALADAGLLAPELPEPVWRPHAEHEFRYLAWPVPVVGQVERSPRPGALIAITDGDEDIITFTEQQAREVAAALLSAAAWAEKQ